MRLGANLPPFRLGPPTVMAGSVLALLGFLLPWVTFQSVLAVGAPDLAGYELPKFLSDASVLLRLAAEQAFGDAGTLSRIIWSVPVIGLVALLLAVVSHVFDEVGRWLGIAHVLLGVSILVAVLFLFRGLSQVIAAGFGTVLEFVGIGLWLTLFGMLIVVVGGILEMGGR